MLALLLPQACQAHGGPQLQRLRSLTPNEGEGALEASFRLTLAERQASRPATLPQHEFPLQTMQLRGIEMLRRLLSSYQRFLQCTEPCRDLSSTRIGVCEQREQVGT